MTDKFNKAVLTVLKHEGGFVNNANDPGGATNYGVSLRFLLGTGDLEVGDIDHDGDIDYDDIKKMTIEQAKEIYFKYFWTPNGYENINDIVIATKIFDMSVNMGAKQAHILLQRAIRAAGIYVVDDGALGPKSYAAMNSIISANGADAILAATRSEQAGFYRGLIIRKPTFEEFRAGWMNRAYS